MPHPRPLVNFANRITSTGDELRDRATRGQILTTVAHWNVPISGKPDHKAGFILHPRDKLGLTNKKRSRRGRMFRTHAPRTEM